MKKFNYRPLVIYGLLVFGAVLYYFGELADWAAWDAVRLNFFYGIHDVHRLVFLAPIAYAAYTAGRKLALITTLVSLIVFLPRAFFISPYPDPLLRMLIFVVIAGAIGWLIGALREQTLKSRRMEQAIAAQRDRMLRIIDDIAEGIMITGPDYRIRLLNSRMSERLGDCKDQTCHEYLYHLREPCPECKIQSVIKNRKICSWQCRFHDGSVHEVISAPYTDADGAACQISVFRDIAPPRSE